MLGGPINQAITARQLDARAVLQYEELEDDKIIEKIPGFFGTSLFFVFSIISQKFQFISH